MFCWAQTNIICSPWMVNSSRWLSLEVKQVSVRPRIQGSGRVTFMVADTGTESPNKNDKKYFFWIIITLLSIIISIYFVRNCHCLDGQKGWTSPDFCRCELNDHSPKKYPKHMFVSQRQFIYCSMYIYGNQWHIFSMTSYD